MITGYYAAQAIHAAAKLGIADQLRDGRKSSAELAQATGSHAPSLYRLLRALASVGLFDEDEQGRFALTPLGANLRTDVPDSAHPLAIVLNEPWYHRAWEDLLYSVKTGERAFDHVHRMGFWEHMSRYPEDGALFDAAMTGGALARANALLAACDWSGVGTLVDVGGGQGQLLAVVLSAHPEMRGVLIDRQDAVAAAPEVLAKAGVADRCEVVAGDLAESVPSGGDAYVLSLVLHGMDDARAGTVLRNCRQAMRAGGKVLVVEHVVLDGNSADPAKFGDLNMLVMVGGHERTAAEFDTLLQAAGLRLERDTVARPPWHVIEGIAA